MLNRTVFMTLAIVMLAGHTMAATSTIEVDLTNTIPNVIANALIADGEGDDWTGAVLQVDLTAGSVYNAPAFDADNVQDSLWGFVPLLRWDSAVGIANDGSAGTVGGGGDLGGCTAVILPDGTSDCGGIFDEKIRMTWFNTRTSDTGPVQIGNISLTDDAAGSWSMITSFAGGQVLTSGPVINGVMAPEPGAMVLMVVGGLTVLRRRHA